VHAVVAATVRVTLAPIVEIETLEGRRFRYAPVANIRVSPGDVLKPGAVLGTVPGEHAAYLELSVRDPDGRWVDPYPLLVGLADPNELGVDARTGDGIDPDSMVRRPRLVNDTTAPAPVARRRRRPRSGAGSRVATTSAASTTTAAPPPPPPPAPAPRRRNRVSADILAAMIAPTPPGPDPPRRSLPVYRCRRREETR
jgi:hypothetical protein